MIEVRNLTKNFGNFPAITDISFNVEQGEILGFLGPNGAGKSTTMKIITGFLPPSSGTVTVAGYDIVTESLDARRHIGYLPETVPLYTDMTVSDYLEFMGKIRGMSSHRVKQRIDDVIQNVHIEDYRSTIIEKLSKGFRQRVGIAQAILHEPDVLVLDEPTIGIDPIQIVETREMIKELGGEHTVIISTHILPEVSMICERVIIIHEGQIIAVDKPANLGSRLSGADRILLDIKGPQQDVLAGLRGVDGVEDVERERAEQRGVSTYTIVAQQGVDVRPKLATKVVESGWDLMRLEAIGMSLEEIFLRLTTEEIGAEQQEEDTEA